MEWFQVYENKAQVAAGYCNLTIWLTHASSFWAVLR